MYDSVIFLTVQMANKNSDFNQKPNQNISSFFVHQLGYQKLWRYHLHIKQLPKGKQKKDNTDF